MRKSNRFLVKLVSLVILLSFLGAIMVSSVRVNHFVRTRILGQKDQVATAGTITKNDAVTKAPVSAETIKNDPKYQITVGPDGNQMTSHPHKQLGSIPMVAVIIQVMGLLTSWMPMASITGSIQLPVVGQEQHMMRLKVSNGDDIMCMTIKSSSDIIAVTAFYYSMLYKRRLQLLYDRDRQKIGQKYHYWQRKMKK